MKHEPVLRVTLTTGKVYICGGTTPTEHDGLLCLEPVLREYSTREFLHDVTRPTLHNDDVMVTMGYLVLANQDHIVTVEARDGHVYENATSVSG